MIMMIMKIMMMRLRQFVLLSLTIVLVLCPEMLWHDVCRIWVPQSPHLTVSLVTLHSFLGENYSEDLIKLIRFRTGTSSITGPDDYYINHHQTSSNILRTRFRKGLAWAWIHCMFSDPHKSTCGWPCTWGHNEKAQQMVGQQGAPRCKVKFMQRQSQVHQASHIISTLR